MRFLLIQKYLIIYLNALGRSPCRHYHYRYYLLDFNDTYLTERTFISFLMNKRLQNLYLKNFGKKLQVSQLNVNLSLTLKSLSLAQQHFTGQVTLFRSNNIPI